jgi:hypothetical protein
VNKQLLDYIFTCHTIVNVPFGISDQEREILHKKCLEHVFVPLVQLYDQYPFFNPHVGRNQEYCIQIPGQVIQNIMISLEGKIR